MRVFALAVHHRSQPKEPTLSVPPILALVNKILRTVAMLYVVKGSMSATTFVQGPSLQMVQHVPTVTLRVASARILFAQRILHNLTLNQNASLARHAIRAMQTSAFVDRIHH